MTDEVGSVKSWFCGISDANTIGSGGGGLSRLSSNLGSIKSNDS